MHEPDPTAGRLGAGPSRPSEENRPGPKVEAARVPATHFTHSPCLVGASPYRHAGARCATVWWFDKRHLGADGSSEAMTRRVASLRRAARPCPRPGGRGHDRPSRQHCDEVPVDPAQDGQVRLRQRVAGLLQTGFSHDHKFMQVAAAGRMDLRHDRWGSDATAARDCGRSRDWSRSDIRCLCGFSAHKPQSVDLGAPCIRGRPKGTGCRAGTRGAGHPGDGRER